MDFSLSNKIISLENLLSAVSWLTIFNFGVIAYYSHDLSFLFDIHFYFAELLILVVLMVGLLDVNYSKRSPKQKFTALFLVLIISTILHFQFEHNFKYFFFGQET